MRLASHFTSAAEARFNRNRSICKGSVLPAGVKNLLARRRAWARGEKSQTPACADGEEDADRCGQSPGARAGWRFPGGTALPAGRGLRRA